MYVCVCVCVCARQTLGLVYSDAWLIGDGNGNDKHALVSCYTLCDPPKLSSTSSYSVLTTHKGGSEFPAFRRTSIWAVSQLHRRISAFVASAAAPLQSPSTTPKVCACFFANIAPGAPHLLAHIFIHLHKQSQPVITLLFGLLLSQINHVIRPMGLATLQVRWACFWTKGC
jgi:hypothetical protein